MAPGGGFGVLVALGGAVGAEGTGTSTRPPAGEGRGDAGVSLFAGAEGEVCGFTWDPAQPVKRQASRIDINRRGFIVGEGTQLAAYS
ncbi:MAG: hypothetical protein ACRDIU_05395 [Actinomycetota bacterium]